MSSFSEYTVSPLFAAAFRDRARELAYPKGGDNWLPFDEFMRLALYHPELGYYRRDKARVGRNAESDFYTATSSGPLFGELVCAACAKRLAGQNLRDFTFVEIGAEPGGGILKDVAHSFGAARELRLGDPLNLPAQGEHLVVFSNELFDAQPVRRVVGRDGTWREIGVRLNDDGRFEQIEANTADTRPLAIPSGRALPATAPEGYLLDLPLAAAALAQELAAQPWKGLFIACDYGKSWRELIEATPQGTTRAYRQHQQSNDLLAFPGEQDLTAHVCWDWLSDALGAHGFASPQLDSQEAFFVRHAGEFIGQLLAVEAARFSQRKMSLLQLIHPANLGQKFQVLHALRA